MNKNQYTIDHNGGFIEFPYKDKLIQLSFSNSYDQSLLSWKANITLPLNQKLQMTTTNDKKNWDFLVHVDEPGLPLVYISLGTGTSPAEAFEKAVEGILEHYKRIPSALERLASGQYKGN